MKNVVLNSYSKTNTILTILESGIYLLNASAYIQEGDVKLSIYKNNKLLFEQRTTTVGCTSLSGISELEEGDTLKFESLGIGREYNYSILKR